MDIFLLSASNIALLCYIFRKSFHHIFHTEDVLIDASNSSVTCSSTVGVLMPNATGDETCKIFSLSFFLIVNVLGCHNFHWYNHFHHKFCLKCLQVISKDLPDLGNACSFINIFQYILSPLKKPQQLSFSSLSSFKFYSERLDISINPLCFALDSLIVLFHTSLLFHP